jgi:hypothetical protein
LLLVAGLAYAGIHVLAARDRGSASAPSPPPSSGNVQPGPVIAQPGQQPAGAPPGKGQGGGYSAAFTATLKQRVAGRLHLSVGQITAQVSSGKQIADVATAQGVSADQLHGIILDAYQAAFDQAVRDGIYTRAQADGYMSGYRGRTASALNGTITEMFGGGAPLGTSAS